MRRKKRLKRKGVERSIEGRVSKEGRGGRL